MSSKVDTRRMDIIRIMQSEGRANVAEIAKMHNVTMETIRADFDYLAEQHGWSRTHGGMEWKEFNKYNMNYFFYERQVIHMEEKRDFAAKQWISYRMGNVSMWTRVRRCYIYLIIFSKKVS